MKQRFCSPSSLFVCFFCVQNVNPCVSQVNQQRIYSILDILTPFEGIIMRKHAYFLQRYCYYGSMALWRHIYCEVVNRYTKMKQFPPSYTLVHFLFHKKQCFFNEAYILRRYRSCFILRSHFLLELVLLNKHLVLKGQSGILEVEFLSYLM